MLNGTVCFHSLTPFIHCGYDTQGNKKSGEIKVALCAGRSKAKVGGTRGEGHNEYKTSGPLYDRELEKKIEFLG